MRKKLLIIMLIEAYKKSENSTEKLNACKALAKLNGLYARKKKRK